MLFNSTQFYIVTGASSGIGECTSKMLNELGASVVAIARSQERLNNMKAQCLHPENMHLEIKELTEDLDNLPNYVGLLKEKYGKFSGMAYCAGVSCVKALRMLDYYSLQDVFKINYFAPILLTKGLLDRRNNIGKGCSLVFLSSLDAYVSARGQSAYSGTKAALAASIKAISKEYIDHGIRLNCILPSMIKTPMAEKFADHFDITEDGQKNNYPLGWGQPEDVANMIVYLLSNKSKYISGQNYVIDSGLII